MNFLFGLQFVVRYKTRRQKSRRGRGEDGYVRESGEMKGHTHTWWAISFNILAVVYGR